MNVAAATRPALDAALAALLAHERGDPLESAGAVQGAVGRAERAIDAHEYGDALAAIGSVRAALVSEPSARLRLRALYAESWALMYTGQVDQAMDVIERARGIVEDAEFTDVDRAEALYRLGCCRVKVSSMTVAAELFTLALDLCERSGLPCDALRANIFEWRSRCYQRQRDFDAARADVERAIELAEGLGDTHAVAHGCFQASLVAEREQQWMLARFYAERAHELYLSRRDWPNVARLQNNLGAINFLLGRTEEAVARLRESVQTARRIGNETDAAQAISSLAQVHLRTGQIELAEKDARVALEALEARPDYLEEAGNCRLVLGRALLQQGRFDEAREAFGRAEAAFTEIDDTSQLAASWVAQGDLARAQGDPDGAADLFRRAAEALQDFHF